MLEILGKYCRKNNNDYSLIIYINNSIMCNTTNYVNNVSNTIFVTLDINLYNFFF